MKKEFPRTGQPTEAPQRGDVFGSMLAMAALACGGLVAVAYGLAAAAALAADPPLRVGVIGLDAHAVSWAKILAAATPDGPHPELTGLKIVAAVPAGSPDIPEKQQPLADGIAFYREAGIELVDSIAKLLPKVDAVMILSVDGRPHLPQAREVIAAGKPVFIDKPVAASLTDARQIYALAEAGACLCSRARRCGSPRARRP